jgi:hypothetical protein
LTPPQPAPPSPSEGLPSPQGFKDLLKNSWALYKSNFVSLIVVFLALAAAFLLVILLLLTLPDQAIVLNGDAPRGVVVAVGVVLLVFPPVVGGIAVAAAAVLLTDRLVGKPTHAREAYRELRPRLGSLIAAGLAATLLSVVLRKLVPPVAFFIQPLLYGPAILVQVIALETRDLRAALARAGRLLRREASRIFMYLFVLSLGVSLLGILLPGFASVPFSTVSDTAYFIVNSLLQILAIVALIPFVAAAMLVGYLDLRARKENLELTELATERGASN